eukprot:9278261-Pyramimonas_sp.AAC.1
MASVSRRTGVRIPEGVALISTRLLMCSTLAHVSVHPRSKKALPNRRRSAWAEWSIASWFMSQASTSWFENSPNT